MITYTYILLLLHVLGLGVSMDDNILKLSQLFGSLLILPVFGRVLGWW